MFHTGEEVICIWPGKANGPDCVVGNRLIVRGIAPEHTWNGEKTGRFALVFDCHPYIDKGRNCASAQSYRFQNYKEWLQEEYEKTNTTNEKVLSLTV